MTLLELPVSKLMPPFPPGRPTVPVMFVPMKLPCTVLFEAVPKAIWRPLPEMTLRASTVVPPMRAFVDPAPTATPTCPFAKARVPVTSVPIKLPCTVLPEPPPRPTPSPIFPEIRLRAAGVVPPMVQFDGFPQKPKIIPPCAPEPFGNAIVPAGLVPMKFPSNTPPSPQERRHLQIC